MRKSPGTLQARRITYQLERLKIAREIWHPTTGANGFQTVGGELCDEVGALRMSGFGRAHALRQRPAEHALQQISEIIVAQRDRHCHGCSAIVIVIVMARVAAAARRGIRGRREPIHAA